jgi:hypothetical protein
LAIISESIIFLTSMVSKIIIFVPTLYFIWVDFWVKLHIILLINKLFIKKLFSA